MGKRPKELKRGDVKVVTSFVILPSLAEADEAEAPAWGIADREVAGLVLAVQVEVVVAAVSDLPRAIGSVV